MSPLGWLDWHWSGRHLRGQLAPGSNLPPGGESPIVHCDIWMTLNTADVVTLPASLQELKLVKLWRALLSDDGSSQVGRELGLRAESLRGASQIRPPSGL